MHGGALYSLADIVSGLAACAYGPKAVPLDGSLNFLNPAINTEYVYCEAIEQRRGKDVTVYRVELTDDNGKLLDVGTFTFFILAG